MTNCRFGPGHPEFLLTKLPDGSVELSVCWDSTNVRQIAADLRRVASELDQLPEDTTAEGVHPL